MQCINNNKHSSEHEMYWRETLKSSKWYSSETNWEKGKGLLANAQTRKEAKPQTMLTKI